MIRTKNVEGVLRPLTRAISRLSKIEQQMAARSEALTDHISDTIGHRDAADAERKKAARFRQRLESLVADDAD